MMKRIFALILLIGFVLLIMNMFWWKLAPELTLSIYVILVVYFLLSSREKRREENENRDHHNPS